MEKKTWTKKELAQEISDKLEKELPLVQLVVQAFIDKICEKLSNGERLEFRDFGVFDVVERKEKIGRNPRTGIEVKIPKHFAVKFTSGKGLGEKLKELTKKRS